MLRGIVQVQHNANMEVSVKGDMDEDSNNGEEDTNNDAFEIEEVEDLKAYLLIPKKDNIFMSRDIKLSIKLLMIN